MQERITLLDKKVEKMKTELSKVLGDVGYANAVEFLAELLRCEEKRCIKSQGMAGRGVKAEISIIQRHTILRKQQGEVKEV